MIKILVSSCLLGTNCKWNGRNNAKDAVITLGKKYTLVPFCTEVLGGMPIPRIPSEIQKDNKVMNQVHLDVTNNFMNGSKKALEIALKNECQYAILKDHSPSCGTHKIYDGTFSRVLVDGKGMTARLLEEHHIKTYSEEEVDQLLKELGE